MFKITLHKLRASAVSILKLWCEIRRYRFVLFPEHLSLWTFIVPRYQPFRSTQHSNLFEVIVHVPKYNPEKIQSWWLSFEQKCLYNQKKEIGLELHIISQISRQFCIVDTASRFPCGRHKNYNTSRLVCLQCIKFVLPAREGTTAKVLP